MPTASFIARRETAPSASSRPAVSFSSWQSTTCRIRFPLRRQSPTGGSTSVASKRSTLLAGNNVPEASEPFSDRLLPAKLLPHLGIDNLLRRPFAFAQRYDGTGGR